MFSKSLLKQYFFLSQYNDFIIIWSMSIKDFLVIAKLGIQNYWEIIILLGEGAYSSVYKVKRIADNAEYALKKVKL